MSDTVDLSSDILSVEQVAALLGVDPRTLRRRHAEGMGPPRIKIGRKVVYLRASLIAWLRDREKKGVRA